MERKDEANGWGGPSEAKAPWWFGIAGVGGLVFIDWVCGMVARLLGAGR